MSQVKIDELARRVAVRAFHVPGLDGAVSLETAPSDLGRTSGRTQSSPERGERLVVGTRAPDEARRQSQA